MQLFVYTYVTIYILIIMYSMLTLSKYIYYLIPVVCNYLDLHNAYLVTIVYCCIIINVLIRVLYLEFGLLFFIVP